jgi:hypothetical protein
MLQCGLRKRRGALGVVLRTSQYIVGRTEGEVFTSLQKSTVEALILLRR